MDTREYGRAFGFNDPHTHDEEEAMASPPPTITRRSGKIPRSPIPQSTEPQSMPQLTEPPTDTPDTDEDTYDNEQHTTPTPIRKRPSAGTRAQPERIPQTETSTSQSSIEAMVAANMQMMQTFIQIMERMASFRRALSSSLSPQPITNPYDDIK